MDLRAADALNFLEFYSAELQENQNADTASSNSSAEEKFLANLNGGKSGILANEAEQTLEKAVAESNNPIANAEKVILKAQLGKNVEQDLLDLKSAYPNSGMKMLSREQFDSLVSILQSLYSKKHDYSLNYSKAAGVIQETIESEWFRKRVLLDLYKTTKQQTEYKILLSQIKTEARNFIVTIGMLAVLGLILVSAGLGVIIWRLCFRKPMPQALSVSGVKYNWPSVFVVFYAWFFTQVLFGVIISSLKTHNMIHFSGKFTSPTMAILIAVTYLLSNGPALLYIYFFALKPNHIPFREGICLRSGNGLAKPWKLVGAGFLAWVAAVPLVIIAFFISVKLFNASGSSNPIIAIIMDKSNRDSLFTILVFYSTLGIMAPFIEESLFRGFFYTFLRKRYNVIFSTILSAGLFAAVHLDPGAILPLFCLGAVFSFVVEITGSTIPAIVAHGLWNSGTFTLLLILFGH